MTFDPLGFIASIKTALIVGSVSLAVGFAGGYITKGKFDAAKEVPQLKAVIKGTAAGIVEQHQASQGIEAKAAAKVAVVNTIKTAAAKRVINQETQREQYAKETIRHSDRGADQTEAGPVCPRFELDVGTVRLLNAAREGRPVDPAGSGDAALETPSGVGIPALIDNDLDVVKTYHDLATRHDALVDWVEKKLREQAGQK